MDGFWDYLHRFWTDLLGRTEGPMTFRLFLQPVMALIAALHDGIKDARLGRSPYFFLLVHSDRSKRLQSWREGVTAVTRVLLLGVGMDVIYQFKVFGAFKYPIETFVVAVVLAFVPYLLLRGPIERVAKWWMDRSRKAGSRP